MVLASILVFLIEREFAKVAAWSLAAAGLSLVGLIHAYTLEPTGVQNRFGVLAAPDFAVTYLISALIFLAANLWGKQRPSMESGSH